MKGIEPKRENDEKESQEGDRRLRKGCDARTEYERIICKTKREPAGERTLLALLRAILSAKQMLRKYPIWEYGTPRGYPVSTSTLLTRTLCTMRQKL